jgi:hypothetical protein
LSLSLREVLGGGFEDWAMSTGLDRWGGGVAIAEIPALAIAKIASPVAITGNLAMNNLLLSQYLSQYLENNSAR